MATMTSRLLAFSSAVEAVVSTKVTGPTAYNSGVANAIVGPSSTGALYDPTTYAKSAVLFRNETPVAFDFAYRNLTELRATLTRNPDATGRPLMKITPGFGVQGHNFLTQAGFFLDPILRGCGLACTVLGSGSTLRYKPVSSGYESIVCASQFIDDTGNALFLVHNGSFGTFKMSGAAGEEVKLDPSLSSLYVAPTTAAKITAVQPTNIVEVMENVVCTVNLDATGANTSVTVVGKSFSYDHGGVVSERKDFAKAGGFAGLRLTDRQPALDLVVEADPTQVVQFLAEAQAQNHVCTVELLCGSVAGRKWDLTFTGQLQGVDPGTTDTNLRSVTLKFKGRSSTAEGEFQLDFK